MFSKAKALDVLYSIGLRSASTFAQVKEYDLRLISAITRVEKCRPYLVYSSNETFFLEPGIYQHDGEIMQTWSIKSCHTKSCIWHIMTQPLYVLAKVDRDLHKHQGYTHSNSKLPI